MSRIIFIVAYFLMTLPAIAQDNLSAVIEVRYEGVEIRRNNSELWLGLPQNAVAFIGAGDTIRTDDEGRAIIQLDDHSQILLLSNSDVTINSMSIDNQRLSFSGIVNGNVIVETTDETDFDIFEIELTEMTITRPANVIAIWSFEDAKDAVTVADGVAVVMNHGIQIEIPAESGYLYDDEATTAIAFDPEWHAAGLEAILFGCDGEIQTAGGVPLLVRAGPGSGFLAMGSLDVSRIVSLMGVTESTGWSRIQFLTGFGWIQSRAVKSDCTNLPIFPDDSPQERFVTVVNVLTVELPLTQPFFMTPANNAFTYRFASN